MDRILVDIISPRLSDKGRRIEIYMFISFGLLFLCYPINLLTGEGVLYKSIAAIFFLNMLFWVAYNTFVDKYVSIGQIIFDLDQLIIEEKTGRSIFKIVDITNLTILYYGYEYEPFLISYRPFIRSSTGYNNILSFKLGDINLKYRFAIRNKTVWTFLSKKFEDYKILGADIKIEKEETFVEF